MTLERAITLLKREYDRAKSLDWVHKPTAYALYRVWRLADKDEEGKA